MRWRWRGLLLAIALSCTAPWWAGAAESTEGLPQAIRHVDLVHFSHTDYGFTDHPSVCRELQKRYLDIAVDAVLATMNGPEESKFCWTAETTVAVDDWWNSASPSRRKDFLRAVRSGQLEVAALPLNQTPTLNRPQWHAMLHWLPEDLWQHLRPVAAVQNDVNGTPRAGATAMLDRDVRYLFTGINADSGGPPRERPSAFWWKMPDGRRMFVWLNLSYPEGFSFFHAESWRRGPVPLATDTRYRPARPGEFFATDEASLRRSHQHLVGRLRALEAGGYRYPTLLISMTNEWRMDNDPPFPPLADFVGAWNRLGLKPALRLTTVSAALKRLEQEIGDQVPTCEGEWTDWWANGVASGPRELSASRLAKRLVGAAESPLWGPLDDRGQQAASDIYRDLCLFDEHTWGSSNSVALPDDLETVGQYNEKARFAYRPLALARLLLSQRVRTRLANEEEGLYLANTARLPFSGWVTLPATCLRGDFRSLEDLQAKTTTAIEFRPGLRPFTRPGSEAEVSAENRSATFSDSAPGQLARFWVENLEGGSVRRLRLTTIPVEQGEASPSPAASIEVDEHHWPSSATWPGMSRPLFLAGLGDCLSVGVGGFAPRWIARDIWDAGGLARSAQQSDKRLEQIAATPEGAATCEKNRNTTVYTQVLRHPRLRYATRQLELWNREPRARLTLRIDRTSNPNPEVFFATFTLPCEGTFPVTSNGGLPFVPYRDQLAGTCRDHFAIDDYVHYATPQGHWLWVSRDVPLVSFGSAQVLSRAQEPPKDMHRVLAMLFNNMWYTNFVGDSHGVMEFQFDLTWRKTCDASTEPGDLAAALLTEPQVIINPNLKESPIFLERLYRP